MRWLAPLTDAAPANRTSAATQTFSRGRGARSPPLKAFGVIQGALLSQSAEQLVQAQAGLGAQVLDLGRELVHGAHPRRQQDGAVKVEQGERVTLTQVVSLADLGGQRQRATPSYLHGSTRHQGCILAGIRDSRKAEPSGLGSCAAPASLTT